MDKHIPGIQQWVFPFSSLIPSSSYFQCLMQTVSHFSSIYFCATLNSLQFPSVRPSSLLFLWKRNENQQILLLPVRWGCAQEAFRSRRLIHVHRFNTTCGCTPRGKRWHFLNASAAFFTRVDFSNDKTEKGGREAQTCVVSVCIFKLFAAIDTLQIHQRWWSSEPGMQSDYRGTLAITLYPDRPA